MADKETQDTGSSESEKRPTPYFDSLRHKHAKKQEPTQTPIQKIENELVHEEEKIIQQVKQKMGPSGEYFTQPKHIRVLKIIAILIPVAIILYIFYANFLVSQNFNYFYDIGGAKDASKSYITPITRISEIANPDNITFRNATSQLVYFNVPMPRGSETLKVESRFQDDFPKNKVLKFGASVSNDIWNYTYIQVFSQTNKKPTGNWIEANATFNISDLAIKNGQLSMLFNIPHLGQNATLNFTIPIDWINITVHKPGLWEKWREK